MMLSSYAVSESCASSELLHLLVSSAESYVIGY
jgi:hypothetical protein